MIAFPTPHTLTVRRVTYGPDRDLSGNLKRHEGAEHDWPAYFIHAGELAELTEPNRDAANVLFTIGAPESGLLPTRFDEVLVDGEWLGVNGDVKNRNRGPFGFTPGVIVELKAVEG